MLAGRPVVYADFLGYDEAAHHGGLERADSLAVLRSIDQQIGRLYRAAAAGAARVPPRRPLRPRADPGLGVRRPVRGVDRGAGRPAVRRPPASRSAPTGPKDSRRPTEGWQVTAALGGAAARSRAGCGPGSSAPRTPARPRTRARGGRRGAAGGARGGLRRSPATPRWCPSPTCPAGCRWRRSSGTGPTCCPGWSTTTASASCWCTPTSSGRSCSAGTGCTGWRSGVVIGDDPLLPYGEHAAALVARVSTFPHCADVVINSRYDPDTDEASAFEPHVGSHGGLGGPQQRGFLTYPRDVGAARARSSAPSSCTGCCAAGSPTSATPSPPATAPRSARRAGPRSRARPGGRRSGVPRRRSASGTESRRHDRTRDHGAGPLGATRRRSNSTPAGGVGRSRPGGDRARTRTRTGRRSPGRRPSRRRAQRRDAISAM